MKRGEMKRNKFEGFDPKLTQNCNVVVVVVAANAFAITLTHFH